MSDRTIPLSVHTCQQWRRRCFLWSVRWLYHEHEASSTHRVNKVTTEKPAGAVQFEVELVTREVNAVNISRGRRIKEVSR
jgi:hypothetical protein